MTTQNEVGTIIGSNYGGHAPLVGAHVYLLQASTSGYAAPATSLLGTSYTGSSYPTTENTSDTGIPTTGAGTPWYYETTDSTGAFNITGDYSCTSGYPVYLYAYGGTPTTLTSANNFAISSFNVVTAATAGSTLKFTVATESFANGDQIILSGFGSTYSYLNGQSAKVIATGLTTTTFELEGLTGAGSLTAGNTYTATGVATQDTTFNPGVVNLAMLGVCPSSGSFSTGGTLFNGSTFTPLQYVYVNEVSTVAAAYAMAGFGTDGLHIGTDTSASPTLTAPGIVGIQNAAMNAGNLYDIQGKYLTTGTPVGEGHIANPTTFNGSQNGTVPQAELDTLGNILAACVDSGNTAASPAPTCTTLFSGASSTGGITGGTNATNTAQAAFNIAHFPMTAPVLSLYTLPTGSVPFTPHLTSAPNDFTVGIIYSSTANGTSGASATTSIASPTALAIDSYGDTYVSSTTSGTVSTITKLSPLGTSLATSTSATGTTVPGYMDFLAIDQSGNVWATTTGTDIGSQSGNGSLLKFNATLSTVSLVNNGQYMPTSIAIDTSNNVFVSQNNSQAGNVSFVAEFAGGGTTQTTITNACFGRGTALTLNNVSGSEYIWSTTNDSNYYCIVKSNGTSVASSTSLSNVYNVSLDGSGNGWFSNHNQTNLYKLSNTGTLTTVGVAQSGTYQNDYYGGLYDPAWTAVDGAGNVFIVNDNGTHSSVSEFSNAGTPLSCPTTTSTCPVQGNSSYGYQPGNVTSVTAATVQGLYLGNIVVDPSGDVWVANYSGSTILEIVGVGTPLVTPLSSQLYGTKP